MINFGADIERQDVIEQRFNYLDQVRNGASEVNRDREYTLDTNGAFFIVEQTASELLRWNIGFRIDQLDGKRLNDDGIIYDFGTIVQPKANIFITPNDDLLIFANYGESFQHPYGSALYTTTGNTDAVDVSDHNAWELGTKWAANQTLELRLSYWNHQSSDEFLDLDGYQQIIGDTERDGFDLGLNAVINDSVSLWLNYSLVNSEITAPNITARADNAGTLGNELRSIPEYTTSIGVNYQVNDKLGARLHVDGQGDYYVNENNQGEKFGDYTLVHMTFDYKTSWGGINLQINNLFDEDYEYVYDFGNQGTATVHSPGDGVNGNISVTYNL